MSKQYQPEQEKTSITVPTNFKRYWLVGLLAGVSLLIVILGYLTIRQENTSESEVSVLPSSQPSLTSAPSISPVPSAAPNTQTVVRFYVRTLDGVAQEFQFSAEVPVHWQAEYITEIEAINLYDPDAEGATNLEKSQLFIRHFEANSFLTLSTVTVHSREELTLNGRPAVRYDIEKKASAANFVSQPTWRNTRHFVTDVRVTDANPSTFYVFGQRPDLDQSIVQTFFESLIVNDPLVTPINEFDQRITKKPFGIKINPATSPVQPERFSGYHTGVDIEYVDVASDVSVRAIADGMILEARTVSGYGGVVAIRHTIDGETNVAIYGHLDPANLPASGFQVTIGQRIGHLGDHETTETDGERKHLHFALVRGETVDLRGYVESETELASWRNPLEIFSK